jgi:hypothetical protein
MFVEATCGQDEGIAIVGQFCQALGMAVHELGAAIGGVELVVGVEAAGDLGVEAFDGTGFAQPVGFAIPEIALGRGEGPLGCALAL